MKKAKTITDQQFSDLLAQIEALSRDPERDLVLVLLSFKAGLRVGEIAGLNWRDVCDVTGKVGDIISYDRNNVPIIGFRVPANIAKKGHERTVPFNTALLSALTAYKNRLHPSLTRGGQPIVFSYTGRFHPNTLQKYMSRLYARAGFYGMSSHSGRRTFTTKAARVANTVDCSLRDVQKIVGHKNLSTTEAYIDLSFGVGNLMNAI